MSRRVPPALRRPLASYDRVVLYGVTGSGKSTAAPRLSVSAGLPLTLIDELTWRPGWVALPAEEQRVIFGEIVGGQQWVLEGAYGSWLDLVLPRVELVIGLDYPRWFSLQRLVRRTVARAIDQQPVCNGNRETWRGLLGRDSILLWHARSFGRKRDRMRAWAADPDAPETLLVRRPADLEALLAAVDGAGPTSAP